MSNGNGIAARSDGRPTPAPGSRHGWSVRGYLTLIVVASTVMVSGALVYGFTWGADQARSRAESQMATQARVAAEAVAEAVVDGRVQVEAIAGQPGLERVFENPDACTLVVSGGAAFPGARMDILDGEGRVVCSSDASLIGSSAGIDREDQWLEHLPTTEVSSVLWDATDASTRRPAVMVAQPFGTADQRLGTVALVLDATLVAQGLADGQAMPSGATLVVVDRASGLILSASGPGASARTGRTFPVDRAAGDWVGVDGVRRVYASSDVVGSDWRVYGGAEHAQVVADARGIASRQGLIGGAALVGLALGAWLVNRKIAGPLGELTRGVVLAREGSDDARVDVRGAAELAALAREFNKMLDIRMAHEARLAHQAVHDRLTGLPTTDLLRERLDAILPEVANAGPMAVLCLGLVRFQTVVDSLGRDVADQLLVEVAARISSTVRHGDMVARCGPHDFLIVSENLTGDQAVELAQRLQVALDAPLAVGTPVGLTAAVGIAIRTGSTTAEQLVREADTAMSFARTSGAPWTAFEASMQARAAHHLQTEHELHAAIAGNQFEVRYQPLVSTRTQSIVGAEALVRWRHPDRGLVPPNEFISVAEETGQIAAIGRLVLIEACGQAVAWAADGHPLRVSVNVAAAQLNDPEFADLVRTTLAQTGLPANRLCLEVTESALIRRAGRAVQTLTQLRHLGVKIAIDDFGTGYSSLAYLKDLPVDELKIDRAFVTRIDRDRRDTHVVKAILGMANALQMLVVAEGVENSDQLSILTGLGCSHAQGYLFARPLRPEALLGMLTKQRLAHRRLEPVRS